MDTNRFTQKSLEALQAAQPACAELWKRAGRTGAFAVCVAESGKRFDRSTDEQTRPEHAAGADRM